jgi:hypothetical protein
MPSFIITVNKTTEIRANLPYSASIGLHLTCLCGDQVGDDDMMLFYVGGVDGKESVKWITPELSIGDEITIAISKDEVINSPTIRAPYERTQR